MKNAGVFAGIILSLFSSFLFWQSMSLDYRSSVGPGPGLFPTWLSGFLFVLSIMYIIESLKKNVITFSEILPRGKELRRVLTIIVSLLIFMVIVSFTGFLIAGTIMTFLLLVKEYKWYWGLGISISLTLIIFLAFQILLEVPLPVNNLGW